MPNRLNKYSIRKFTVGTASLLIGATLVFGIGNEAKADEISNTTGQVSFDNESSVNENSSQSSELEKTPSTEEAAEEEQPSTEEAAEEEQSSTEEAAEEEQPSTEETTKEEQPSTEEAAEEEQPSTEETTKEEQSSTEEAAEEEQPSTEETTKEEQPSTEETTKEEQSSTEETTKEEQSSTEETTKEEQSSTEETTKEEQSSTEEAAEEEQPSTEETTKEEQSSTEETTKEEQSSTEEVTEDTDLNTNTSTLQEQLENTENKEEIVNQYLIEQLSEQEADAIIEIANIDYNNATTEEINDEILKAALINLSNEIDSEQPLATRATRMFSAINTLAADTPNETKYQFPTDSDLAYLLRDLKYDATTVNEDSSLRYAGLNQFKNADSSSIKLQLTKWLATSGQFRNGGNINLSFPQEAFSSQIESITLNGVQMTSNSDGSNWSAPVNGRTVNSGLIGVATNHDLIINLKDNQTLQSLGYTNDKPVYVLHTWTNNEGEVVAESIDTSFISPTVETDVDNSKSTGFIAGKIKNQIRYNKDNKTLDSVHTFKPNENFLQSDYNWVLYIKEQLPQDLLPYIDLNNIELYVSDENGNKISENRVVNVFADDKGLVDTSKVDSISILDNNTIRDLNNARGELDRNVFYGALGQSRSYTLSYSLLPGITLEKIAKDLNESTEDARLDFSSWLEADYVDNRSAGSDNGAPFQPLEGSYATSYLDFYDYDNDGVPDIIDDEPEIGNNDPTIDPIEDQIITEGESITPISITSQDDDNDPLTTTVTNLPEGVSYNEATGQIEGTPQVNDWKDTEEVRDYEVQVTVDDGQGGQTVETFIISVNRDTDKDTVADITDTDDDNDGVNDSDEEASNLDPKNNDTDGNGVTDGEEDTDNDGYTNDEESDENSSTITDKDNDGVSDVVDPADTDGDGITDDVDTDDDNDGVNDSDEEASNLDPKNNDTDGNGVTDGEEDTDNDGYTNDEESDENSSTITDKDNDGVSDVVDPADTDDDNASAGSSNQVPDLNEGSSTSNNTDNKGNNEDKALPETGESDSKQGTIFGALFAGLGSLLLFRRRNKKEEK
ncbi:YSIRK-type signal peptide-containing protein [Staphylococcus auricularis]|uniref:YSIRK-type signal peptide-containing protein n=1 Tax=Staphylococcus auricularis TaxID=29379 RepID=UPI0018E4F8EC|nr:YSIRK-type signal peptide-containing protein [Staphylococcus auricularis]